MKKFMKKLHLILAIPSGVFITIICFTGALMSMDEYIRPIWSGWGSFYRQLMSLHRWLMLPDRAVGRMIVAISTIFMIIALISGLVIWLPKKWNKLKKNLIVKRKAGFSRVLLDLHRVLGVYAMLLLLLMCLTGLMWSFKGYREVAFKIFTIDRVPDRVAIVERTNRETGEKMVINFNERPNENKVMRWAYLLHTGRWGGWFGPLVTGVAALIGATLPITGYVLCYRKVRSKKRKKTKVINNI